MSQQKEEKAPPPVVPKDLLEYLERIFPNKVPALVVPGRRLWADVGQQEVITHLRSLFNKQNKPLE